MAKKIKFPKGNESKKLLSMLNELNPEGEPFTLADIEDVCNEVMGSMSDMERAKYQALDYLISNGVTPEDFARYYQTHQQAGEFFGAIEDMESQPNYFLGDQVCRNRAKVKEYVPMPDAHNYTLVLKIQMKDVVKPPMWREVEVPADYDFYSLHDIIQDVMGFDNCHLWQFNKTAYDSSLVIGDDDDDPEYGPFLDGITHSADETPLTKFLQQKGDTLEYTYDFGDDWIFKIEVKEIINKRLQSPICRKFKSDLNPIEDFGGVWSYLSARNDIAGWSSMKPKERKARAEECGFDSPDEYYEFLCEHLINLDEVNSQLCHI